VQNKVPPEDCASGLWPGASALGAFTSDPVPTPASGLELQGSLGVQSMAQTGVAAVPFPVVPWRAAACLVLLHVPSVAPLSAGVHPYLGSVFRNQMQAKAAS
jgi:hypothetical protein